MARCEFPSSGPTYFGDYIDFGRNRYRKYPGWVHLILIRKVTDIAAVGIQDKNLPKRFETAFKDIPTNVWHVFEDPKVCYDLVKQVVEPGS